MVISTADFKDESCGIGHARSAPPAAVRERAVHVFCCFHRYYVEIGLRRRGADVALGGRLWLERGKDDFVTVQA